MNKFDNMIVEYSGKTYAEAYERMRKKHGNDVYILKRYEDYKNKLFSFKKERIYKIKIIPYIQNSSNNVSKNSRDMIEIAKHKSIGRSESSKTIANSSKNKHHFKDVNQILDENKSNLLNKFSRVIDDAKKKETINNINVISKQDADFRSKEPTLNSTTNKDIETIIKKLNEVPVINNDTINKVNEYNPSDDRVVNNAVISPYVEKYNENEVAHIENKDTIQSEVIVDIRDSSREKKTLKSTSNKEILEKYLSKLRRFEYPEDLIDELREHLPTTNSTLFLSEDNIKKGIKEYFEKNLILEKGIKKGDRKKSVIFVGPTGVGKTTTIPKIASLFIKNTSISLVTIDIFRSAAKEQLSNFSDALSTNFYAATSGKDLHSTLSTIKGKSLVFVDTVGRSQDNQDDLKELEGYISKIKNFNIEPILVMSAGTKYYDAIDILENFKKLRYKSVILTKLDETKYTSQVIAAIIKSKVPVSYVANGQSVPHDIHKAKDIKEHLISKLI